MNFLISSKIRNDVIRVKYILIHKWQSHCGEEGLLERIECDVLCGFKVTISGTRDKIAARERTK